MAKKFKRKRIWEAILGGRLYKKRKNLIPRTIQTKEQLHSGPRSPLGPLDMPDDVERRRRAEMKKKKK